MLIIARDSINGDLISNVRLARNDDVSLVGLQWVHDSRQNIVELFPRRQTDSISLVRLCSSSFVIFIASSLLGSGGVLSPA